MWCGRFCAGPLARPAQSPKGITGTWIISWPYAGKVKVRAMETNNLRYATLLMAQPSAVRRLAKWLGLRKVRVPEGMTPHQHLCRRVVYFTLSA